MAKKPPGIARWIVVGADEISLANAITIHKSQGSDSPAVVTPLAMQR
jgi:hypothetical protein